MIEIVDNLMNYQSISLNWNTQIDDNLNILIVSRIEFNRDLLYPRKKTDCLNF